jgi:hypothetical protein
VPAQANLPPKGLDSLFADEALESRAGSELQRSRSMIAEVEGSVLTEEMRADIEGIVLAEKLKGRLWIGFLLTLAVFAAGVLAIL